MEIKKLICPKCFGTGIGTTILNLNLHMSCDYCDGTGQIKITTSKEEKSQLKEVN